MRLEKYKKYQGTVQLTGLLKLASNVSVADKFKSLGFTNVLVEGSGNERKASGVWSKETQDVEIPKQVSKIIEV
jgi:hypothetical protein